MRKNNKKKLLNNLKKNLINENNPFTIIKQPNKIIMILKEASVNFNNIIPKTTSNTTNNKDTFNNLLYLSKTLFIIHISSIINFKS